jgi:hypothetical protein
MPVRSTNTPQFRGFGASVRFLRFPGIAPVDPAAIRFDGPPVVESSFEKRESQSGMAKGRNGRVAATAASCEQCFFHENLLCAVQSGPCATFRPAGPDGLRPPSQLRFVFRQERRQQVAWAFPSANEQVALHA